MFNSTTQSQFGFCPSERAGRSGSFTSLGQSISDNAHCPSNEDFARETLCLMKNVRARNVHVQGTRAQSANSAQHLEVNVSNTCRAARVPVSGPQQTQQQGVTLTRSIVQTRPGRTRHAMCRYTHSCRVHAPRAQIAPSVSNTRPPYLYLDHSKHSNKVSR